MKKTAPLAGELLPSCGFYMIRHGQTEANAAEIMAGQMNSPLSELGRRQAELARTVVEGLEIAPKIIVHSHLDRARDTALTINRSLNLPMIEDKDISEIFVGEWEGTNYRISLELYLEGVDPPGGESHASFRKRVSNCVRRHCSGHEGPVLFVCHGGVMRAVAGIFGFNFDRFLNCHLYEFQPVLTGDLSRWKVWQHDLMECGTVNRVLSPLDHEAGDEPDAALLASASGNR